jgi:nucleotide-binding universal stress UspA family protein
MYETIIVGVDGSKYAERALDVAIDLARFYSSRLIIATVHANDRFMTFGFDSPTPPPPELQGRLDGMLEGYGALARSSGVKEVETKVVSTFWKAAAGLVAEAEKMGCPLIVVGSRGLSGIERAVLGSFAEFVVHNSHCDVHLVRN